MTKREEYQKACENINPTAMTPATVSVDETVKTVKAWLAYLASISDDSSSTSLVSSAIDAMNLEMLKECSVILAPKENGEKDNKYNGGESKLEAVVKLLLQGQLTKIKSHEEELQSLKSALVLNMVRLCVNVSSTSSRVETRRINELVSARILKLSGVSAKPPKKGDVEMEGLTDLFGRTKI